MKIVELIIVDDSALYSLDHVLAVSGLSADDIEDLVDIGVIAPAGFSAARRFDAHQVFTMQTARRLRDDFELDRNGLALALTLLSRISALEAQLSEASTKRATGQDIS